MGHEGTECGGAACQHPARRGPPRVTIGPGMLACLCCLSLTQCVFVVSALQRGRNGSMPSDADFRAAGMCGVADAVQCTHGGTEVVATRLGLQVPLSLTLCVCVCVCVCVCMCVCVYVCGCVCVYVCV